MITIVGMGFDAGDLTENAASAIRAGGKVFVKTAQTPTYSFFEREGIAAESLDGFFDAADDFDQLNNRISSFLIEQSKGKDIVYCVDGNGTDDLSVVWLVSFLSQSDFKIVRGVGRFDAVFAASILCGKGAADGVNNGLSASIYTATEVSRMKRFFPDKRNNLIITEIENKFLASEVKLKLSTVYGDDQTVTFTDCVKNYDIAVKNIDMQRNYGVSTACVVPSVTFLTAKKHDFADLITIMDGLLGEGGCPWDRAQTHESIRVNLIEEAYELVDAIDKADIENMREETGDVLLQSVFHAMLGERDDEFDINEVLEELCHKLISRHTHIFGNVKAASPDEALKAWDNAKAKEKHYESAADKMQRVPKNLPALIYAYKLQKAAAKVGFDWPDASGAFEKLNEEIAEFKAATDQNEQTKEGGDLLFAAVNVLRHMKVEPEIALSAASKKFFDRFSYVEQHLGERTIAECGLEKADELWNEAKKIYK